MQFVQNTVIVGINNIGECNPFFIRCAGFIFFIGLGHNDEKTVLDLVVKTEDGGRKVITVQLAPGDMLAIDRTQIHRGTQYRSKHRRLYFACLKNGDIYEAADATFPVYDLDDLLEA